MQPSFAAATSLVRAALGRAASSACLTPIRLGSAAVLRVTLPEGEFAARVMATGQLEEATGHARLAGHLAAQGVGVICPADEVLGGPGVHHAGCVAGVVAWWHWEPRSAPAAPEEVGVALAALHRVSLERFMPALDPLAPVERWLAELCHSGQATAGEQDLLRARAAEARAQWDAWLRGCTLSLVHGDASANVLATPRGPVLMDLETMGAAPWWWEWVVLLHGAQRFGTLARLERTIEAYERAALPLAREELTHAAAGLTGVSAVLGAAFAVARRGYGPAYQEESLVRLETLRGVAVRWHPL